MNRTPFNTSRVTHLRDSAGVTRLKDAAGVTLVELIITMGVGSLLIILASTYFQRFVLDDQKKRSMMARDELVYTIQVTAATRVPLQKSLNKVGNEQYTACVLGGGCTSFVTHQYYPITLYSFDGITKASGPGWPWTGAAAPVWYAKDGAPCIAGNPLCVFSVESGFRAQCAPPVGSIVPAPVCVTPAEFIQVMYKIKFLGNPPLDIPPITYLKRASPVETTQLGP